MASKQDKVLAALRSLSPPSGGTGEAPREPSEPPASGPGENDKPDKSPGRRRSIELSLEEIGVFFLAATMLVVIAFLMGWYGRGVALPAGSPSGGGNDPRRRAETLRLSAGEGAVRDLGERRSGVRPSARGRFVYTIMAAKFPGSGAGEAAHYVDFLSENGFVPAFLRATRDDAGPCTELCVGRFASQSDPVLVKWLPQVRRLRNAFAGAFIARIPAPSASLDDARGGE